MQPKCLLFPIATLLMIWSYPGNALRLGYAQHFQQWYPQFREKFEAAIEKDCKINYDDYVKEGNTGVNPESGAAGIVTCLYEATDINDGVKANLASATVLLGFMPVLLAGIGSSLSEQSLLSLRRPMLAALLAVGSLAPSPIRTFEYFDPNKLLADISVGVHIPDTAASNNRVLVVGQYLLVLASGVNIFHLSFELGYQTVSSWAPSRVWTVLLWTILGVVVHIFACICLLLRVKVVKENTVGQARPLSWSSWMRQELADEFTVCASHTSTKLETKVETPWFVFLTWLTAVGTALQIIYGTLTFSGLLFISVQDATIVVARYVASALICRVLLMSELNGMRKVSMKSGSRIQKFEGDPGLLNNTGIELVTVDAVHVRSRPGHVVRGESGLPLLSSRTT